MRDESLPSAPLLAVEQVRVTFDGLVAVNDVSLSVQPGLVFGVIGPNGAGKTTLFNSISGLVPLTSGRILVRGHDMTRLAPVDRARLGLARTFQNLRLFPEMTVFQTVLVARYARRRTGVLGQVIGLPRARQEEEAHRAAAFKELKFVGLAEMADLPVKQLPYGHRRRLEIARALATEPALLMLDEPAAGMNPQECNELVGMISQIRSRGVTVVLVEHHMRVVMAVCDRIAVLNYGEKLAEGSPAEIQNSPEVIAAYLGSNQRARAS